MKILLVSDDENYAGALKSKLIFLRNDDDVVICNINTVLREVELTRAEIVLVHECSIELIKELKKNKNLCVVLISDNRGLILEAYDNKVDDFISPSAEDFELVTRIVNNIKHNSVKLSGFRNEKLLEQMKVINGLTGIYNYNFARQTIENYIDDNLLAGGTFVVISPSQEFKTSFSEENFAEALKSSVRANDTLTHARGTNFYILLPDTDFNGAVVILNKIKENYGGNIEVCAGIADISGKSFEKFEKEAVEALSDANATGAEFVFAHSKQETLDEWLDDSEGQKGYKIFRQMFNKKLEKVIAPVFYRLQKAWEEKLFDTKIEQYTTDEQCVFSLKSKKQESSLKIVYPGFANIIIYITHEGLESPENQEIQLSLKEITQKELIEIIENFIKDFKRSE